MSKPTPTPGPWRVQETSTNFTVVAEKELEVVRTSWHSKIRARYPLRAEAKANAHLIAAAPCLLHELQHLVRLLEPLERDGRLDVPGLATLNGARTAIAKATGA